MFWEGKVYILTFRSLATNIIYVYRYQQCLEKVQVAAKERGEGKLNEAEQFLLVLGRPHLRLLESLSLWKFRWDCDAMEREICNPLRCPVSILVKNPPKSQMPKL